MNNCQANESECQKAIQNLYLVLDREADPATCEEIQAHIESCSGCLSEYDVERVVKALVSRSCTEIAPEPLRQKVLFSIRTVRVTITET